MQVGRLQRHRSSYLTGDLIVNAPSSSIPGHEYLAFLSDPAYWPHGGDESVYAEEVVLQIDGQSYEQDELTPDAITENSEVIIVGDHVFEAMQPLHSLQDHFDSWREANTDHPVPR